MCVAHVYPGGDLVYQRPFLLLIGMRSREAGVGVVADCGNDGEPRMCS